MTWEFEFRVNAVGKWERFLLMQGGVWIVDLLTSGSNLCYYDQYHTVNTIYAISPNTWYEVKVVANTNTDTFDIYIDDILRGSALTFKNPASYISKICYRSGGGTTGTSYFDWVRISVP